MSWIKGIVTKEVIRYNVIVENQDNIYSLINFRVVVQGRELVLVKPGGCILLPVGTGKMNVIFI